MMLILRPQDWYYSLIIYCVHWSSKWHGNPQPMMNPWLRGPADFLVSTLSITYIPSVERKRKADYGRIFSICHQCEKATNIHIETWCPTLFLSSPSSIPAQIQLSPFPPATPACQLWWFSWATWTPFFYPELPSKFGVARWYHISDISGQTSRSIYRRRKKMGALAIAMLDQSSELEQLRQRMPHRLNQAFPFVKLLWIQDPLPMKHDENKSCFSSRGVCPFLGVHSKATFSDPPRQHAKKKHWPALPSLAKVSQFKSYPGKEFHISHQTGKPENHHRLKFVPFWGWDMWSFKRSYVYSLLYFYTFWTRLLFVGAALVEWCGVAKCISWWANISASASIWAKIFETTRMPQTTDHVMFLLGIHSLQ